MATISVNGLTITYTTTSNPTNFVITITKIFASDTLLNNTKKYSPADIYLTYYDHNTSPRTFASFHANSVNWGKIAVEYFVNTVQSKIENNTNKITVNKTHSAQTYTLSLYVLAKSPVSVNISIPAKNHYTVTYNANGGTNGSVTSATKWYGETLTLTSASGQVPTRTGYTFQGWGESASSTTKVTTYTGNAAKTYYAIWKINTWIIGYNANGGSGAPASQTKTYNQTLTLSSTVPTRTDFRFLGWGTSASATTPAYQPGGSYTNNAAVTLYAIWERIYDSPTIIFNDVWRSISATDSTPNDEGTYLAISLDWSVYPAEGGNHIASIVVVAKELPSGSIALTQTFNQIDQSAQVGDDEVFICSSSQISTDAEYEVAVTLTDSAGGASRAVQVIKRLPKSTFTIDAAPGGTTLGLGGIDTGRGIDVYRDIYVNKHSIIVDSDGDPSDAAPPEANKYYAFLTVRDSDGERREYLEIADLTDGYQGLGVNSSRMVNGSRIYHGIHMELDSSGNRRVRVNETLPWRNGLGATNGVWPLSMGGTEQNNTLTWYDLPLSSSVQIYSDGFKPQYTRWGRMVYLAGAVKPKTEQAANATLDIGTLPAGYRPAKGGYLLHQGSGNCVWHFEFASSGLLRCTRYRNENGAQKIATGSWLVFSVCFICAR